MTAATNNIHRPTNSAFWSFNALVWASYATLLMIPWLGRYSIPQMLPNKLLIAGTGIVITGGLRALYRYLADRNPTKPRLVGAMVTASLIGALCFDAIVISLTQGPSAIAHSWDGLFGGLNHGIPVMGRAGQYALVLLVWSLGLHLFEQRTNIVAESPSLTDIMNGDGTLSVVGSTVHARDGQRVTIVERDEIQWIAADGDYVRLHVNGRSLLIRATMKRASTLLAPLGFIRLHRSTIINPRYARELVRDASGGFVVLLRGGVRVKVGRQYAAQLTRLFE